MTTQRQKARLKLFEESKGRCYCGRQVVYSGTGLNRATIDHLVPKSRGGTWRYSNLVVACRSCNLIRGDLPPEEWFPLLGLEKDTLEYVMNKYRKALNDYKRQGRTLQKVRVGGQRRELIYPTVHSTAVSPRLNQVVNS